jgi:hypothetical protein
MDRLYVLGQVIMALGRLYLTLGKEGCIGPSQRRGPIQPSEGHYDLTEDI